MVAENCTLDNANVKIPEKKELKDGDHFLYFAYGSNLLEERIHVQVKGAVFKHIGVLSDYQLVFFDKSHRWQGALGSIERKSGSNVWGCVWQVSNSFALELDRQECGYHRLKVEVNVRQENGLPLICRTYQYSNPQRTYGHPSPHYKQVIVAGAIEHKLPVEYIQLLAKIPTNGYRGRVQLKLEAIKHLNPIDEDTNEEQKLEGCDGA